MKKVYLLFVVLAMLLVCFSPFAAANSSLSVEYSFGLDHTISPNETIPVTVTIKNSGADFKGDFVFDNKEIYNGGVGVVLPFEVRGGESVSLKFYINGIADQILDNTEIRNKTFVYEDSYKDGKQVALDFPNLKAPTMLSYEAHRMLVISDNADILSIVEKYKNAIIRNAEVAQITNKDVDALSSNKKDLAMFNVILIDPSGADMLSTEQEAAIHDWLRQGGRLLLTGDVKFDEITPLLAFNDDQVTVVNSSATPTTIQKDIVVAHMDYSSGQIMHASEGFENERFAASNQAEKMLASALQKTTNDKHAYNEAYNAANWSSDNTYFDTFYIHVLIVMLVLIVYILIVGPLLYMYVKKKDQREKMWLYIPIIAIVSSVLLFVFGAADRLFKPQTQLMELVSLSGSGDAQIDSAYTFISNKRGDYTITAPLDSNITAYQESNNNLLKKTHQFAVLEQSEQEQVVTLRKVPYWSVQGVIAEEFQTEIGQLTNALYVENGIMKGKIINDLTTDVEQLMLLTGREVIQLGNVQAGETLEINEKIAFTTLARPFEYLALHSDEQLQAMDGKEKMHAQKMQSIVNVAIATQGTSGPILIGIADGAYATPSLSGKQSLSTLSIVAQKANIELAINGPFSLKSYEFDASLSVKNPNEYAEIYIEENNVFGTMFEGDHTLTYSLQQGVIPASIQWNEIEVSFNRKELEVDIYNLKTKQFEPLGASPWENKQNMKHYIDGDNSIRFNVRTTDEFYGTMVEMPTFIVRGEAVND